MEAVQGKQVSLEWTETSGGFGEWWHDPGFPLAFPVESAIIGEGTWEQVGAAKFPKMHFVIKKTSEEFSG